MSDHQALILWPNQSPEVGSLRWKKMVNYRLRQGYGVEDIALQIHCAADHVRAHVQSLRARGFLAQWWPRAS